MATTSDPTTGVSIFWDTLWRTASMPFILVGYIVIFTGYILLLLKLGIGFKFAQYTFLFMFSNSHDPKGSEYGMGMGISAALAIADILGSFSVAFLGAAALNFGLKVGVWKESTRVCR